MVDTRDRALLQHTTRQDTIRFETVAKELKAGNRRHFSNCKQEAAETRDSALLHEGESSYYDVFAACVSVAGSTTKPCSPHGLALSVSAAQNSLNKELRFDASNFEGGMFEWRATLSALRPAEKYRAPLTSSQEIGWE
ncbi:hypothetical protein Efla_003698 [Eimeria flavescens]